MNKIILKIKFLSDKSFELTLIYVDDRLLSKNNGDFINFNSDTYDFLIYSNKKLKIGEYSLRLPDQKNYKYNTSDIGIFRSERLMYLWLKKFHNALNQCNNNFTPFVKDKYYKLRERKMILNGEYWMF